MFSYVGWVVGGIPGCGVGVTGFSVPPFWMLLWALWDFASDEPQGLVESLHQSVLCFNVAVSYMMQQDWSKALFWLDQSLRVNPAFIASLFLSGVCYFQQRDYLLASLEYSRTLELFRDNISIDYRPLKLDWALSKCEVYYNRALAYGALGVKERALEDITLAMRYRHDHPDHFVIGRLRSELTFVAGEQASSFLGPHGLPTAALFGAPHPRFRRPPPPSVGPGGAREAATAPPKRKKQRPVNPFIAEIMAKQRARSAASGGGGAGPAT